MNLKSNILILSISVLLLFSCGNEVLGDACSCELSGQEVILDYKKEYYWIEIINETENKLFGPYESAAHGYAAIRRCEELEKKCKARNEK